MNSTLKKRPTKLISVILEDQDHTIFHNIYHLGTVNIGDPKAKLEN